MRKVLKAIGIAALAFLLIGTVFASKAFAKPKKYKFEVNTSISVPEIEMQTSDTYVLDHKSDDVNGDGYRDNVVLAGYKPGGVNVPYSEEIYLFIQDGKTKNFIRISPGEVNAGYNPKLYLGDFNGDKVSEIFVSIDNGGDVKTSTYRLIAFKEGKAVPLFNEKEFSEGLKLNAEFKDNFKAEITYEGRKTDHLIDISEKKNKYIELGIYDAEGKLLKPTVSRANPYSDLRPEDVDKDEIYELIGVQKIKGEASIDTVAIVETIWKFTCCSKDSLKGVKVIPAKE